MILFLFVMFSLHILVFKCHIIEASHIYLSKPCIDAAIFCNNCQLILWPEKSTDQTLAIASLECSQLSSSNIMLAQFGTLWTACAIWSMFQTRPDYRFFRPQNLLADDIKVSKSFNLLRWSRRWHCSRALRQARSKTFILATRSMLLCLWTSL